MKVLALIKQVPAKSVPMDSTDGILDRTKSGGRMNPWDYYALEGALKIGEELNCSVSALTMGPSRAEDVLREAVSLGAGEGVLLTDKAFSGADVYATSYTLLQGIKALGDFDVIVCGQQTTDGDTAQVPFSLGEKLGVPTIGWVKEIVSVEKSEITVLQELSCGTQKVTVKYPCLLALGDSIGRVRQPNLRNKLKAQKVEIKNIGLIDLENKNADSYGLKASPTRVINVKEVNFTHKNKPLKESPKIASEIILNAVKEEKNG